MLQLLNDEFSGASEVEKNSIDPYRTWDVGFVDRYKRGDSQIVVHVREGRGREVADHFAVLQRLTSEALGQRDGGKRGYPLIGVVPRAFGQDDAVINEGRRDERCVQASVLSDVVQVVERPEEFVVSLVRLYGIEDLARLFAEQLFSSSRFGLVSFGGFEDGEAGCGRVSSLSPVSDPDIEHGVVESRTEALKPVLEAKRDVGRDRLNTLHIHQCLASARIDLLSEGARWSSGTLPDEDLEVVDMFIGPFYF